MIIDVRQKPARVVELEDEGTFALTMQQAEEVRRNAHAAGERRQQCEVVIVVSSDGDKWADARKFWSGPWRPSWEGGIPLPSKADLIEVARHMGARYARSQVRSII